MAGIGYMIKQWLKFLFPFWFKTMLNEVPTPPQTPQIAPPVVPVSTPPADKITLFCLAIQSREGYYGPNQLTGYPAGTPAYVNKNPGNLRCDPVNKTFWNRKAMGQNNGFCVFPDYDTGFESLKDVVTAVCKGQVSADNPYMVAAVRIGLHDCSYLTIIQYFTVRDPKSDSNDPMSFANEVAGKVGVSPTALMRDLVV